MSFAVRACVLTIRYPLSSGRRIIVAFIKKVQTGQVETKMRKIDGCATTWLTLASITLWIVMLGSRCFLARVTATYAKFFSSSLSSPSPENI